MSTLKIEARNTQGLAGSYWINSTALNGDVFNRQHVVTCDEVFHGLQEMFTKFTLVNGGEHHFIQFGDQQRLGGIETQVESWLVSKNARKLETIYLGNRPEDKWAHVYVWDDGALFFTSAPPNVTVDEGDGIPEARDEKEDDEEDDKDDEEVTTAQVVAPAGPEVDYGHGITISVFSGLHQQLVELQTIWDAHTPPPRPLVPPAGVAFLISEGMMGGFETVATVCVGEILTRTNYMPDVLEGYDRAVEDLNSQEPRGRLTILEGSPGTGKTHMVRALMSAAPTVMFVIVPPSMISKFTDPKMTTMLLNMGRNHQQAMCLVLEDAETCLLERTAENISAISTLLNLSDGIVGSLLNLRIVATTNTAVAQSGLDKALLRKGRLSSYVKVGDLNHKQAEIAYRALTKNEKAKWTRKGATPLADIYDKVQEDRLAR